MKAVVEKDSQCDADNLPLDDWETAQSESAINKQLEERLKQVKILQREKADKDARIEKARQDEAVSKATKTETLESASPLAPFVPPVKMQILRRPKSDDQLAEAAKVKKDQEKLKPKTLEEKQAAYEEARSRILGSDYKPDTTPAPQTSSSPVASRNRSPEQIRVRRPSPETMFVPCYQPPPSQQYQMPPQNYAPQQPMPLRNFVPMTTQPYMYVDTSRPPPLILSMAGPSSYQQQIPTFATGQYLGNPSDGQYMPSQVPYGRPPIPLFPPGTLGAAMQVVDSGQSQAQRKNRHNKKKSKEATDAVY